MALSNKQLAKYEAIKKDMLAAFPEKEIKGDDAVSQALRSLRRSISTRPYVIYHGMPGDILRVSVTMPTKIMSKEDKDKVVAVLKKHKMKKIQEIYSPARAGGITWYGFDA